MKTILFSIGTLSLFIFSYLAGMVMMANKKGLSFRFVKNLCNIQR